MNDVDPFGVLGLGPTLDGAAVKRAWFAALARHPPQQDPEGFRRLREAYEQLQSPGGLVRACACAPVDASALLARWEQRHAARLEQARLRLEQAAGAHAHVATFLDGLARLSLAQAVAHYQERGRPGERAHED